MQPNYTSQARRRGGTTITDEPLMRPCARPNAREAFLQAEVELDKKHSRVETESIYFAKSVCASCPLQQSCLTETMRAESGDLGSGIFGGLTPLERKQRHHSQYSISMNQDKADQLRADWEAGRFATYTEAGRHYDIHAKTVAKILAGQSWVNRICKHCEKSKRVDEMLAPKSSVCKDCRLKQQLEWEKDKRLRRRPACTLEKAKAIHADLAQGMDQQLVAQRNETSVRTVQKVRQGLIFPELVPAPEPVKAPEPMPEPTLTDRQKQALRFVSAASKRRIRMVKQVES